MMNYLKHLLQNLNMKDLQEQDYILLQGSCIVHIERKILQATQEWGQEASSPCRILRGQGGQSVDDRQD